MSDEDGRLRRLASTASLAVAVLLTALKLAAALLTGSVAILSSLVDSVADIAASAITFFSVRLAQQPPDRRHRFGHGKAESLSALAQAALVGGAALFVLVEAIRRVVEPEPVRAGLWGLGTMAFALTATLLLVLFQGRVVRLTGSQAIAADRLHYQSDFLSGAAVIGSLLASELLGLWWADPLFGVGIALWLLHSAWRIGHEAVHVLMDHELPAADRERIKAIVTAHPEVEDLHDLRTRGAAGTRFIEFHIEIDGEMSVHAAHRVTDALERELADAFPDSEIIIHQEPAGLEDDRLDHRIAATRTRTGA
ncbi:cation diffusion facilitator family transporter [Geminicoccaceae bacterium 1502E]|nr:cation diffusion facilitator family transporter [Geminicoccaceae bacterium 1502E]